MFVVESYAAVKRFVFVEGHSRREAASVFGLSRDMVRKMCLYSARPGYRRSNPPTKPKLGALLPVIDAILDADREAPGKQQHTATLGRTRGTKTQMIAACSYAPLSARGTAWLG